MMLALCLGAALAADVDIPEPAASFAAGRGGPQAEAPQLGAAGFTGGVRASFAEDLVVRTFTDGPDDSMVRALAPVHLQASWTLGRGARVDVLAPLYARVDAPLTGFTGTALGDVRLGATIPLWVSDGGAGAIALIPRLSLPTGDARALVSGGIGGGAMLTAGADTRVGGWVANAGVALLDVEILESGASPLGSRFDAALSTWANLGTGLRAGVEADLGVGLIRSPEAGANRTGTAHAFAQGVLPRGIGLALGAGTGMLRGLGTARYRVFGALSYTASKKADRDDDGVVDDDDPCPDEPEDMDGFDDLDGCPDLDNDADGIIDVADACPNDAEDLDLFDDEDGCPDPDNDGDTLADADDACPDAPGSVNTGGCPDRDGDGVADGEDTCPDTAGDPALQGCPDADGDGVPDPRDQCPDQPKPDDEDPTVSDGCPKTVYVTVTEIKILQRVEFETGSHTLRGRSLPVLFTVAGVLNNNDQVDRLEVQGHTDATGSDAANLRLSQRRAEAVVAYLVSQGIAPERLVARGYGESLPRESNATPSGREANRRVQFLIRGPDQD